MSDLALRTFLAWTGVQWRGQSPPAPRLRFATPHFADGDLSAVPDLTGGDITRRPTSRGTQYRGADVPASWVLAGRHCVSWSSSGEAAFPELAGVQCEVDCDAHRFATLNTEALAGQRVGVIATIDGQPWFVRVDGCDGPEYLLGIGRLPDLEDAVESEDDETRALVSFAPLLLFLRRHYPQHLWLPAEAFGNFIIDDPLLKPVYGFLNHERLANVVEKNAGAATIAFIPWNARRSKKATAELYRRSSFLGLCIHGNEHTKGEFAGTCLGVMRDRAVAAVRGMELHRQFTGLDYERVMVFPQGKFSHQAMQGLAEAGIIAAVNSHILAENHGRRVRVRHIIEPALTCYGACTLLRRRYPVERALSRYDAVFGRPVLMVEHHQYFKDGGVRFDEVLAAITREHPGIRWTKLGEIVSRVRLTRLSPDGAVLVRFYADRFIMEPVSTRRVQYRFERATTGDGIVTEVTVDKVPVRFAERQGWITFEAELQPDRAAQIAVHRAWPASAGATSNRGIGKRLRVAARRYLSDIRDDYLHTNPLLDKWLTFLRRPR